MATHRPQSFFTISLWLMAAAIWVPYLLLIVVAGANVFVLLLMSMAITAVVQGLRLQSPTLLWGAVGLLVALGFASIFSLGFFVLASSVLLAVITMQSAAGWNTPTITARGWLALGLGIATVSVWFI